MSTPQKKRQDPRPARIRLKHWRELCGLTQEQAALKLSVSLNTYQGWESGARVPQASTSFNVEVQTGIQWNAWLSAREGWGGVTA
jgi:transcriptional regulator with XRE-family HTH domain